MMPMGLGEVLTWLIYCWTYGFASTMSRVWMNENGEVGFRKKNVGLDTGEVGC